LAGAVIHDSEPALHFDAIRWHAPLTNGTRAALANEGFLDRCTKQGGSANLKVSAGSKTEQHSGCSPRVFLIRFNERAQAA
jgi:hypothetical protein